MPGAGPIEATDIPLKQVLIGPYTIARLADPGGAPREVLALGLAEALNAELRALAEAGCPIIQIDEGALTTIGDDAGEWRLYEETQRRLTAGLDGHHLSLGIYRGAHRPGGPRDRPRRPVPELPGGRAGRSRCLALRVRGPGGDRAWSSARSMPRPRSATRPR